MNIEIPIKALFYQFKKLNSFQLQSKLHKQYIYCTQYILKQYLSILVNQGFLTCIETKTEYSNRKEYKLND